MFKLKTIDQWEKRMFIKRTILLFLSLPFFVAFGIMFLFCESRWVIRNFYYLLIIPIPIFLIVETSCFFYKKYNINKKMHQEIINSSNQKSEKIKAKVACIFVINKTFDQKRLLENKKQLYSNVDYYVLDQLDLKEIKFFCNNNKIIYCKDNINNISKKNYDFIAWIESDIEMNYIQNNLNLFYSDISLRLGYIEDKKRNYVFRRELIKEIDDYVKPIINMKKNCKNYLLFGTKYPWTHFH